MPLEPRVRALVALANRLPATGGDAPIALQRAAGVRQAERFGRLIIRPGRKITSITHRTIPVSGGTIVVRIYRQFEGALPLHVFFHGGGWCAGTLNERDSRCQDLAADVGCVVASVDYRLAPENQYPTAPEDCFAALCWLVEHADELAVLPSVVSVGGESAGGNLAAVVCLMARDRGGPPLVLQMLDVPATDLTLQQPSMQTLGTGYLLTKAAMTGYVKAYVADSGRIAEPYASPLQATDLSGLPPAWIMTAEYDPLHDEGEAYANRLRQVGVPTDHRQLPGHIHPSFAFTRLLASAREYHSACVKALQLAHQMARSSNVGT